MMKPYDLLIVGAGLFGSVVARQAADRGWRCLVVDKRSQPGGNIRCEQVQGITVHTYGAHIFHTSNSQVWEYVQKYCPMRPYVHTPMANYRGEIYNLPFNMNTFARMWGVALPEQAEAIINQQRAEITGTPANLEQQAIALVGRDLYQKLVRDYTQKQWGRPCDQLPAFIIRRLPVRMTYDNNYFNDPYQGIPVDSYNTLIDNLLDGIEVRCGVDYLDARAELDALADRVLYTGQLDALFGHRLGRLEYRSLRFETQTLQTQNYQGCSVMNYTDADTPYTRIIEHRHFKPTDSPVTVITREYSAAYTAGSEAYYPVNDAKNDALFAEYKKLADATPGLYTGGRLAAFRYMDMDRTIEAALGMADEIIRTGR